MAPKGWKCCGDREADDLPAVGKERQHLVGRGERGASLRAEEKEMWNGTAAKIEFESRRVLGGVCCGRGISQRSKGAI